MVNIVNIEAFKQSRQHLFETTDELQNFINSIFVKHNRSFRVNELVISPEKLLQFPIFKDAVVEQTTWDPSIFKIKKGNISGECLEHFAGLFYLQNLSSTLPVTVLAPEEGDTVLDMCASPGSKTTQAAIKMKNLGTLIANDISWKRLMPLSANLSRLGLSNAIITRTQGQMFGSSYPEYFDKIILDAPCSGEGSWYKHNNTKACFKQSFVKKCTNTQKDLAVSAFKALKPGGTMVYSTCTFSIEENEEVVDFILKFSSGNLKVAEINLDIPGRAEGILYHKNNFFHSDINKCVRIYPHRTGLPGFFLSKLVKSGKGNEQ